jgi:hypothetical protein
VPTSTLRHWLREAGVQVGADGTLTGTASPAASRSGTDKEPPGSDRPPGTEENEHGSGGRGTAQGTAAPASADSPPPGPAAASGAPVQTLNELAQAGYVTDLAWESAAEGAAHQPVFCCTVTARVSGIAGPVSERGTGASKATAKASAAAALLAALAGDGPGAAGDAPTTGEGVPR